MFCIGGIRLESAEAETNEGAHGLQDHSSESDGVILRTIYICKCNLPPPPFPYHYNFNHPLCYFQTKRL